MNNKETGKRYTGFIILIILVLCMLFRFNSYENSNYESSNPEPIEEKTVDFAENSLDENSATLTFRNQKLKEQHYTKHGIDMGFKSADSYEAAAAAVVNNPSALHKTEAEDGDDVYYLEKTNEFVIVSTDGYIRTYFNPNNGIDYFNRQ